MIAAGAGMAYSNDEAGAQAARQQWLRVLAKATVADLENAWAALPHQPEYRLLRPGETGLVMVRGRIGGTGQPFNFGEMTITRAVVQLIDVAGHVTHTGFGHVAGRSVRHAELVAVFDALLQDPAQRDVINATVIEPISQRQEAIKANRAAKLEATKVDFFTMVRGE